ncbi:hypothetical protein GCM10027514_06800 [Azotobacter armeniacus]
MGLADYSSGLFLAAPRRTGKSTFLREDLIPECLERGWYPVYVDLWANKESDPAMLISSAIAQALVKFEGRLRKLAKSIGVEKINILHTLSWDFSKPQLPEGATLAQALTLLHRACGQMVVLVIDEAQHALTTEAGINAMFGLKAARDELNQGQDGDGLRLVFTGSSRDKLAHLVLNTRQPFYGSSVTPFPLLGDDFTRAYTEHLNANLAAGNQFDPRDVGEAFQLVGCRPELLRTIIAEVSLELGAASNLGELLRNGAELVRAGVWTEFESSYNGLTLPQRAVLEVMANCSLANQPFTPYSEATVQEVGQILKAWGSDVQPSTTTIQTAIESLRDKELVWRASRGAYALEDKSMAEWLQHYRKEGQTPGGLRS